MKCDCCGKRKCLFETYEDINYQNTTLNICVKCSTLVYKIRDAIKENQLDKKNALVAELNKRMCKESSAFNNWLHSKILKSK